MVEPRGALGGGRAPWLVRELPSRGTTPGDRADGPGRWIRDRDPSAQLPRERCESAGQREPPPRRAGGPRVDRGVGEEGAGERGPAAGDGPSSTASRATARRTESASAGTWPATRDGGGSRDRGRIRGHGPDSQHERPGFLRLPLEEGGRALGGVHSERRGRGQRPPEVAGVFGRGREPFGLRRGPDGGVERGR